LGGPSACGAVEAMYYLSRSQCPSPAEAPCLSHVNEKHEWDFNQRKHREAIDQIGDRKTSSNNGGQRRGGENPEDADDRRKRCQALSRRFAVDAQRAEIGRENRKMVDKLTSIAKTHGSCAPPSNTNGYGPQPGPQPGSMGGSVRAPRPPVLPGASERSRSLNDNFRRKEQLRVNHDNAGMVRRILNVKSTFDPAQDARDFKKQRRNVNLLQRLPEGGRKNPRSLPPLSRRPSSYPDPARGLETLMLPGDLHRCQSGPGAFGREAIAQGPSGPSHATTAPAGSLPDIDDGGTSEGIPLGSQTYSFAGFDTYGSDNFSEASESQATGTIFSGRENSAGLSQNTMPRPAVGPGPEEEAGSAARGASAFGKTDSETERRQWTGADANKGGADDNAGVGVGITSQGGASAQPTPGAGKLGLTGMSSVSELQYADDWDEYSMNSSGGGDASKSAAPSRETSRQSVRSKEAPPASIPEGNAQPASIPEEPAAAEAGQINTSPFVATETPAADVEKPDFSAKKKRVRN